jgi:hypothetical protein
MAKVGWRVLYVLRETAFRDDVMGELEAATV